MSTVIAKSYIKGIAQAPRKVSVVASLVRDRKTADAVVILNHTPRRSALAVRKAIESAVANLLNKSSIDSQSIKIDTIVVSAGPRSRRYMPASRGRALPFEKKTSNILVVVSGEEKAKAAAKKAEGKE